MQEKQCGGAREEGKRRRAEERLLSVGRSLPTLLPRGACILRGMYPPHRQQKSIFPLHHPLLAQGEGTRLSKWGWGPSSPTHTRDPLTTSGPYAKPALSKQLTFPKPQKKDHLKTRDTASPHCSTGFFLNKSPPERSGVWGEIKVP